MKYEIKHRCSGAVLFSLDCDYLKICVQAAVTAKANLRGSDLSYSNLRGSDLSYSDLSYSDLSGSDLSGIPQLEIARRRIIPEEGEFIGWKKLSGGIICKLKIPADAQRVNAIYSRKCRASKVIVAAMYSPDGDIFAGIGIGLHDEKTKYKTGKETFPDSFDDRITEECSNGIHFYITRAEAEAN